MSAAYITGGFEPSAHPPGLGNPFATRSSTPPSSYIAGGSFTGSAIESRESRDRTESLRIRSPKPYKPSPTSSRTLTPGMAVPAEASTSSASSPTDTYGEPLAPEATQNRMTTPIQGLQAMSLEPSTRPTDNANTQSRPTTSDSSTNSSSISMTTSSINTTPGQTRLRPARPDVGQPLWTHRLSASFNAMAAQVEAASQAIALIPPHPAIEADVVARVEALETTQARIEEAIRDLKLMIEKVGVKDEEVQEVSKEAGSSEPSEPKEEVDVAALKKLVEDLAAKQKIDQQRLPTRLHNSIITTSKGFIKPVVFANGKPPPQFPTTRGEFFHLTKERYEGLMKGYGIPVSGDLNAKRNAVREFVGLPE